MSKMQARLDELVEIIAENSHILRRKKKVVLTIAEPTVASELDIAHTIYLIDIRKYWYLVQLLLGMIYYRLLPKKIMDSLRMILILRRIMRRLLMLQEDCRMQISIRL